MPYKVTPKTRGHPVMTRPVDRSPVAVSRRPGHAWLPNFGSPRCATVLPGDQRFRSYKYD
ncbi:hypothetical protein BGY98DRAFT_984200 [Russula aff. rugulosa BPL654]|nr:hypothetical protein BGY98DRAFT_984200 [Russula aff. rugulosa BPL654]